MAQTRYLTKSRYKLALECPTKLFYTGKDEFPNTTMNDPFMAALAEGGYQVGELSKKYVPDGVELSHLKGEEAVAATAEILTQEQVIIYEAAIKYKNLYVRVDILVKQGNKIELIEVKSKTYDPSNEYIFIGKKGGLVSGWKPYLHDVAFQSHVLIKAYPHYVIDHFFMLADKTAIATTDGLNQKFKVTRTNNGNVSVCDSLSAEDIKDSLLTKVLVNKEIEHVKNLLTDEGKTFSDNITYLADRYEKDIQIFPVTGVKCKKCEFVCSSEDEKSGLKNGLKECWKQDHKWQDSDFDEPNILEIWNFPGAKKLLEAGKLKLVDLTEEDINVKEDKKAGLSASQRQWLQVEMRRDGELEAYLDKDGLRSEMQSWTYPLHFIDFETSTVALPFTKGRRPYETIAFQFSHHIVDQDGNIEHAGQYINTSSGVFPNVEFVRELKRQLQHDNGTIFRYATHENTVLNHIVEQINASPEPISDADELIEFIYSITHLKGHREAGDRNMVDMLELVKRYYYHPDMKGANSIKAVLPAMLNSSKFLQQKYSQSIYGKCCVIPSLNFEKHTWINFNDEKVIDPYKQLPKLFADISEQNITLLSDEDELGNGGAAMTAYARLQFESMSDYERSELEQGLLKYCELDTLAMVMLYEGWAAMAK
jgi:hypothetical protein